MKKFPEEDVPDDVALECEEDDDDCEVVEPDAVPPPDMAGVVPATL